MAIPTITECDSCSHHYDLGRQNETQEEHSSFFYVIACLAWNASASIEQQIESLINQLSDEDGVVRRNATLNLVRIGKPAVPELVRVLPQADFQLRFAVVDTLNQMAPADALGAVPALMATLRQPNFIDYSELGGREFHGLIAETLAAIGSPAAGPLVEALNDVNEDTRYYVVWALEWMGSEAQAAVPALIQLLKDKDDGVRQAAASVLGTTAQPNVADIMLPPLEDLLTPRRKPALSQANHPAQPAVPTLIKMLGDEDENDSVHVAAARTLGRIGDVTAVPVLITSLNDRNDQVRSTAATALGEIGNSAQTAVPTLINMLKMEAHDKVRRDVVLGLAGIGTPDALNALIEAIFNDESSLVRKEAVLGLGRID